MPTQDEKYAIELLKSLLAAFKLAATVDHSVRPSFHSQPVLFKAFHEHACRWVVRQDARFPTFFSQGYVVLAMLAVALASTVALSTVRYIVSVSCPLATCVGFCCVRSRACQTAEY